MHYHLSPSVFIWVSSRSKRANYSKRRRNKGSSPRKSSSVFVHVACQCHLTRDALLPAKSQDFSLCPPYQTRIKLAEATSSICKAIQSQSSTLVQALVAPSGRIRRGSGRRRCTDPTDGGSRAHRDLQFWLPFSSAISTAFPVVELERHQVVLDQQTKQRKSII
jgi:hypothetical protein